MKLKKINKKKNKIIYLDHLNYKRKNIDLSEGDEMFYLTGHTSLIARKLVEYYPNYKVENWRMDRFVKKIEKKVVQNVLGKVYPSWKTPFLSEFSLKFFIDLKKEVRQHNIIIHHSGVHSKTLFLLSLFFSNTPLLASQFGDLAPSERKTKTIRSKILTKLYKIAHKRISMFFVASQKEIKILKNISGIIDNKILFPEIGTDINIFKSIDKTIAREKLNLPIDHKIILFVGRFDEEKGLDILLNILTSLIKKYNNKLTLLLVGGNKTDRLFDQIKNNRNIKYFYVTPYHDLPLFHNAADVFVKPSMNNLGANSVGANVVETLCCGTPVCSPNLSELPFKGNFGEIPEDESDFRMKVEKILDNPENYTDFSDKIRNLYSWQNYLSKIDKIYRKLNITFYNIYI